VKRSRWALLQHLLVTQPVVRLWCHGDRFAPNRFPRALFFKQKKRHIKVCGQDDVFRVLGRKCVKYSNLQRCCGGCWCVSPPRGRPNRMQRWQPARRRGTYSPSTSKRQSIMLGHCVQRSRASASRLRTTPRWYQSVTR